MKKSLPAWDLSDLYKSINDSKVLEDQSTINKLTDLFVYHYKDHINNDITCEVLLKSIQEYEKIQSLLTKLLSFSYLLYSTDVNNKMVSNFLQQIRDFAQKINQKIVFFDLSLNLIEEDKLNSFLLKSEELQYYKYFLVHMRKFKPYQLSETAEQVVIAKQSVARNAWVKLYDEVLATLEFKDPLSNFNKVNISTILNLQLNQEPEVREQAALSLKDGLKSKEELIVTIINSILKDHSVNNELRGFKKQYSSMNLHNLISDKVMENLVNIVVNSYKDISHRYYKLKAKVLKVDKLHYWDRNAPLIKVNNTFSFSEAKDIVLTSFSKFNSEFGKIGELFFKNNWIDARLLPNKMSGAFAHPTSVNVHPYILVNFYGQYLDVTTLAHELGHGIHQYLARDTGELQSDTPLVLAETASIFGEQLVFDYLKDSIRDKNMHKYLLSNKIEGIINSVHRQIAFHMFEVELHNLRLKTELTAKQIKDVFLKTQKSCLGDAVSLSEDDGIFWSYVSHFFHVPFYVYAYAFGDCLVRSLYSLYKSGDSDFVNKYFGLLTSGGKITPELAIQSFGFNISEPDFWQNGLNITKTLINELESII